MPKQQHKKVKLYTCMPDQTLQVSMSEIDPEWPGFLSDKVGAGRKYLTRGGELFNDAPIATCHTWAEVMAFRPQVDTKPGGQVAAIVTNDAAFPVGRPLTPTESRAAMATSLTVRWTAPAANGAAISTYDVQHRETGDGNGRWTETTDITSTTTTLTSLEAGTEYEVQLKAHNSVEASAWSPSGKAPTNAAAPETPAAPTVSAASATTLTVRWTAPAANGAAIISYDLLQRQTGTLVLTEITGLTVTTTTLTGLDPGTEYEVQVKARNSVGPSAWSFSGKATTASPSVVFDVADTVLVGQSYSVTIAFVRLGVGTDYSLTITGHEGDARDSTASPVNITEGCESDELTVPVPSGTDGQQETTVLIYFCGAAPFVTLQVDSASLRVSGDLYSSEVVAPRYRADILLENLSDSDVTNTWVPFVWPSRSLYTVGLLTTETGRRPNNAIVCTTSCDGDDQLDFSDEGPDLLDLTVIRYAGGTYTRQTGDSAFALLSDDPEAGDATYFIADARIGMIELSLTGGSRANPWGLVWQYWDGSDWQEIDDATDGSEDLTAEGDVVVAWLPRDDMESTTVDSIEGYAVRAFVTASGSGPMDAPTVTDSGYQTGLWWVEVDELEATTVRTATLYLSGPSFGRRDYGTRPATSANSDRPDATATLLNLRPTVDLPAVLGPDGGGVLTGAIEPPVALVTVPNVKSTWQARHRR